MNVRNILILALASLSCLQSYGMEKQIVNSNNSPLPKNPTQLTQAPEALSTLGIKTAIVTKSLNPTVFYELLSSSVSARLAKEDKNKLYNVAKEHKKEVKDLLLLKKSNQDLEELFKTLNIAIEQPITIEQQYKNIQKATRSLKLFKLLPNLQFPQAVFTAIPYTDDQRINPDHILAALIKNEQKNISISCYHLLSDPICNALTKKSKKNVSIEFITNQDQGNGRDANKTITDLKNNGISILAPQNHQWEAMHHKFFIFECNTLNKCLTVTGSYNPTPNGNERSWDDFVILEGQNIAAQYQERFKELKQRSNPVKCTSSVKK